MMGNAGEDRQYGTESVARLRERVAALSETLPLIRQNIADNLNQMRQHYDQRMAEQQIHFDRQVADLKKQLTDLTDEVQSLRVLINARPAELNIDQRRVIYAGIVIAVVVGIVLAFVVGIWLRLGALKAL